MQPDYPGNHLLNTLTPAQRMVLYLIARGNSVKQIVVVMGISRRTVAAHVANAKLNIGASTRDEAIAIAVQNGLLEEQTAHNDNIQPKPVI